MMKAKQEIFSTLWIFVTLNYLYCDLMGLMDSGLLRQYLTGQVEGFTINEQFLFYAAILMEIPIGMVLLSRVLRKRWNGWANIIAGSIKSLVMVATLLVGTFTYYYLFFAVIEIATTGFIVGYAVVWLRQKEALPA